MTPPSPIDQCILFLSMTGTISRNKARSINRYKLQSSLTAPPSHNKREQYRRQPNNQIPQCALAVKKTNCLDVKPLNFPLVYLFLLLSALFPHCNPAFISSLSSITILFYYNYSCTYRSSLSLSLSLSLFSPTWPLATHGPRSSQRTPSPTIDQPYRFQLASRILCYSPSVPKQLIPEKRQDIKDKP